MSKAGPKEVVAHAVETVVRAAKSDPVAAAGDVNATSRVVEREFLPYTDFQRTTRLAIGSAWKTATPAQQQQLFEQFQLLLVHVYALQLTQIHDQKLNFSFSSATVNAKGDDATVDSDVKGIGDDLQVGYRLERTPTGWKIYDIDMMGAWLILVYRQQFADQIAQGGIDGLIKFLQAHNTRFGK
jgi:ABC-type transporter MlaC component